LSAASPLPGPAAVSRRAAVLGSPIAQSLSPVMHRAAYAELGLDWSYEAIECREDALPALIEGLDRSWAGLSLTMPLKRVVLPLLDEVSWLARAVGGANTVVFEHPVGGDGHARSGGRPGGGRPGPRRRGENTDVHGIVAALTEAGAGATGRAVVLGGGATGCSALAALRELGLASAAVVVRAAARADRARAAGDRLGVAVRAYTFDRLVEALAGAELVISTVPAGAADPYAVEVARSGAAVLDVVYAPWPTPLGRAVEKAGGTIVGGFPMLLHQAARQVELMTGLAAPLEAMRAAGTAELTRRTAR
jgi:shikimate dehydrogenase